MLSEANNFTPHPVILVHDDGSTTTIPTIGVCRARSQSRHSHVFDWDSPHPRHVCGGWAGKLNGKSTRVSLPPLYDGLEWIRKAGVAAWNHADADLGTFEPAPGSSVIVSAIAAPVVAEQRPDLTVYVPDTGPESAVRGEDGRIVGVRSMIHWHEPEGRPIRF